MFLAMFFSMIFGALLTMGVMEWAAGERRSAALTALMAVGVGLSALAQTL